MKDNKNSWIKDFDRAKRFIKEKAYKVKAWAKENPAAATAIATALVAGASYIAKDTYKNHKVNARFKKELKFGAMNPYDPQAGHRWSLKRPLTTVEMRYVEARHAAGYRYGEIYEEMKLLK